MKVPSAAVTVLSTGLALAFVAGCPKSNGTASADGEKPPAAAGSPAPIAASSPSGGGDPALSISERFQREAASRPAGTPKAEDAMAAFAKDGIKLNDVKQHLASPIGARYCVGATTEAGVSMSVCEYADEAAARGGRDVSAKAFAAIKNRDIYVNKATTLTLLLAPKTPASEAESAKLRAAFAKLP